MFFSQTLASLILASTALVSASPSPSIARDADLTCYFILTPDQDFSLDRTHSLIDDAVVNTVLNHVEEQDGVTSKYQSSLFKHDDGSYDVTVILAFNHISRTILAEEIESWKHTKLQAFYENFYVNAVNCPL